MSTILTHIFIPLHGIHQLLLAYGSAPIVTHQLISLFKTQSDALVTDLCGRTLLAALIRRLSSSLNN